MTLRKLAGYAILASPMLAIFGLLIWSRGWLGVLETIIVLLGVALILLTTNIGVSLIDGD